MLPIEYYQQACQLFCRLLHQLEELEHGENHDNGETDGSDPGIGVEGAPSASILCSDLPRVSTPEQRRNVSAEMQVDKKFALVCDWSDELIIVDDRDLGLSGQLRMEDRPAFNEMNRKIANGQVKIVIAAQVDRLFRDRWGQEYAKFMEICYTYGVKVITLNHTRTAIDFIYDFSISWHVDQFRRKCEEAWKYIEGHVYRMLGAREEAAKAGRWTGYGIATGYIPDLREKVDGRRNPNYMRFIPYPAHLEKMAWAYQRYRQLAGSAHDLFREIYRQKDFFPPFDEDVPDKVLTHCRPLMQMFKDREEVSVEELRGSGFTIQSTEGLRRMLANPFYAGMLVYKGVLIRSDDHDPVTDLGTFLYAFNRLSPTNLDGTPNEYYEENSRKHQKRFYSMTLASLNGKLESPDPGYRVYPRDAPTREKEKPQEVRKYYAFYNVGDPHKKLKYMIPVADVDACFLQHFIQKLKDADEFEDYLEHEQKEIEQKQQDLEQVERDLNATGAAMLRIEEQVDNGELTNPRLARKANESYGLLEQELTRLEGRRTMLLSTTTRAQRRVGYRELMKRVGDRWHEVVKPEQLPEMIDTFVEKVVLDAVSPRFYTLIVHWRDPEWGINELVCFREHSPAIQWAPDDDALLRERYGHGTARELLELLPGRSSRSMRNRAARLGLKSEAVKNWRDFKATGESILAPADREVMERYGITEDELGKQGAKMLRCFLG